MRSWIVPGLLVLIGTAGVMASGSESPSPSTAEFGEELSLLSQRVADLEAAQGAILARLDSLEDMRTRELRTLLALHEGKLGESLDAMAEDAATEAAAEDAEPDAEPVSEVESLVATARQLIDEDKHQTAYEVLTLALQQDPNNTDALFSRGVACHVMKRYEEAIRDFESAIANTDRAAAIYTCLYNQACGYAILGQPDKAVDKLEESYEKGFTDIVWQMAADPDLYSLRENARYNDFLQRLRTP